MAIEALRSRHGPLPGLKLCVIAYGSLGAQAMEYESDLDLVFLYAADGPASTGSRPLQPERYAARLGQRIVGLLTTMTPAGRLYSVDARLRPNGSSGQLVSTLPAFIKYQREDAWTWELQALCRARAICGDPLLMTEFETSRLAILQQPRDPDQLRSEINDFRQRMREQVNPKGPRSMLKHQPGGLLDIEFISQFGLLSMGSNLLEPDSSSKQTDQLRLLAKTKWLKQGDGERLNNAWLQQCAARRMLTLSRGHKPIDIQKTTANVLSVWSKLFTDAQ